MPKNDSLNGTTLPLRKIRQRESAVPKHRYGRYQIADIINYDKSLAYYVIYTAYFYMLLGNKQRCQFFFTMFEKYDVDIKNWTVPIQKIYNGVSEFVAARMINGG